MKSIEKYLEILNIKSELEQLNEADFSNLISKFTPEAKTKNLVRKMSSNINKKDPVKSLKNINSIFSFVPTMSSKKIDGFIGSKVKEFNSLKRMADVILKNSLPDISDSARDYASSFVAVSSFVTDKNKKDIKIKDNLKLRIKEFVLRTRKFMDEHEPEVEKKGSRIQKEDLPDLAIAWTIVVMSTAIALGIGTGSYILLATIIAHHLGSIFVIIFFIIIFVGLYKVVPVLRG
ncbi:MAG: hypothetical protein ACFFG0_01580 [Candidatus Thorarchaeota archaeon]